MDWEIKTIVIKECVRCKTQWSNEQVQLKHNDQVNITILKIAYCPACEQGFASETDRPTYRREGKRIK